MLPTEEQWRSALEARHGKQLQDRLSRASVAICGLGGLGSNIAIALARAGVGKLILIDFDRVDLTNLHRQQYRIVQIGKYKTEALRENLGEIAPFVQVQTINERLTQDNCGALLRDADVICEAFDKAEEKAMLTNCALEQLPHCILVAASGMAGMGSPNAIRTRRIGKRFYLCGDAVSDVQDAVSLMAPRVMLCAAHQAQTVLRLLAGETEV